jgi:hypothetical protein
MAVTYPLIEFGTGVYATSDGTNTGSRAICTIEGLYPITETIQSIRALDGTIYNQYQAVKDTLVTIIFPLITSTRGDALRDVVQTAISGNTTYALNITGDLGTFTFTAKPSSVTFEQSILSGYWSNLRISQFVTD